MANQQQCTGNQTVQSVQQSGQQATTRPINWDQRLAGQPKIEVRSQAQGHSEVDAYHHVQSSV